MAGDQHVRCVGTKNFENIQKIIKTKKKKGLWSGEKIIMIKSSWQIESGERKILTKFVYQIVVGSLKIHTSYLGKQLTSCTKNGIEEDFTASDRKVVFARFEYKCFMCGSEYDLTIDHHLPLSSGNALTHGNAVILCRSCNSSKGTRSPEEFYNTKKINELKQIIKMEQ